MDWLLDRLTYQNDIETNKKPPYSTHREREKCIQHLLDMSADTSPMEPPQNAVGNTPTIGIDIGAATTRIAILHPEKPMPVIVRNELGNEATSTVVSFPADEARCYGENAVAKQITKAAETIVDLAPWLFGSGSNYSSTSDGSVVFSPDSPAGALSTAVDLATRQIGDQELHPAQVVAFFIKCLLGFLPDQDLWKRGTLCLAVPTAATPLSVVALRQAALLAGVPAAQTLIAHSDEAVAAYFHHLQYSSLPKTSAEAVPVVLIDIGQSCSCVSLILASQESVTILSRRALRMGSEFIDAVLCSHVYSELQKRHGNVDALRGDVKTFRKIVRECRKAKEVLSTVDEARVQLEGLKGDIDLNIVITRALLVQASEPLLKAIEKMLVEVKESLPAPQEEDALKVPRVEVTGGGWRTICVVDLIKSIFGVDRVGVSLDANLAVAEGSAILAEVYRRNQRKQRPPAEGAAEETQPKEAKQEGDGEESYADRVHSVELVNFEMMNPSSAMQESLSGSRTDAIADWAVTEERLWKEDTRIHDRLAVLNRLDSYTLQSMAAASACDATAERKELMDKYLMEIDSFIRSDECDAATSTQLEEKLHEVEVHVQSQYPEIEKYYEHQRAEEQRKEAELVKLSQQRQEEEEEPKSDPQRLRMAQKRREQGQNLFKEECWAEAQTRFVQALALLGQLYDSQSEENKSKKAEISLSCYLNIASCSVKLQLWRNAINNCTNALEMNPDHPKALFRRGQAYAAMKEYKEAVRDLEKAKVVSKDDPAVVDELQRAKKALEAAKAKEKKMFSKMFS